MILISGTSLAKADLPLAELLDYQIVASGKELKLKLKTIASNAQAVYLNENITEEIPEAVMSKIQRFESDAQLLSLLGAKDEGDTVQQELLNQDQQIEEDILPSDNVDMTGFSDPVSNTRNIKEIKSIDELPDISETEEEMYIPFSENEEMSYMQKKLETKENIIRHKNAQLQEMNIKATEALRIRDEEAERLHNEHNNKIKQANAEIEKLSNQINSMRLSPEEKRFLGFMGYVKRPKAVLQEGFLESDTERFLEATKNGSELFIIAAGPNESFKDMINEVNSLVKKSEKDAIFVDFSGDPYMRNRNTIAGNKTVLDLVMDEDADIGSLTNTLGNVHWIKAAPYNDILLLGIDWISLLCRLIKYADGRPVVLLFNTFTSFAVNYTISKLGLLGKLRLFITASTVSMTSAKYPLAFLPPDRVQIVVTSYIEDVQSLMMSCFGKNQTLAFGANVGWNMLGLDIVPVQPFEVEPLKEMAKAKK